MAPRGTQAMLEFPRWKYVVILIVLALSALYALPNIYQKDPAIQITANRGGQIDDALRDLDVVVAQEPGKEPSRYMRGIVLHRLGRASEGDAEIAVARRIDPRIDAVYARYGIKP